MNCCDSWGQCTRGPNCPARPAGMTTASALRDGGHSQTARLPGRLYAGRGAQAAYGLILIVMVLLSSLVTLGALGYVYARWGADIRAALWAAADFAWALAGRWS